MEDLFARKEIIYTIYKEGSFSKAARKLFISQPSLSLMVKKVEDRVGLPLFDRSCKPIRLTEAGMRYIDAVEKIRGIECSFEDYINDVNNLAAGSLGIGSNQLLSSLVLPRYISKFMRSYPKIELSLVDANSTTLENLISSGALDIIIDHRILPEENFVQRHLSSERLLLAVPASFPENETLKDYQLRYEDILAGRHMDAPPAPVPLEALSHIPFILMNRDNDTRKQTNLLFQEAGFSPKVLLEMDRLVTLYAYIEDGTAASVVSDTLISNIRGVDNSRIRYYMLPTDHGRRDLFITYKRNKHYSKAMELFIESLVDIC